MSIMPGIDCAAPLRTLTNSGRGPRPNVRDVSASSHCTFWRTSSQISSRQRRGLAKNLGQTSVVMQNAGGTGNPFCRIELMP